MKKLFSGFYPLNSNDYKNLWKDAYFIFDTNVLLNLYRYNKSTSDELLSVIESLGDKVWIPYIVGLEYQRNRLHVISEQNSKFKKVGNIIQEGISTIESQLNKLSLQKRHSSIEPENFIESLKEKADKFIDSLNILEEEHPSVIKEDKIRNKLSDILESKIGSRVSSQTEIDKLESEAKKRFELSIPPGYKDLGKNQSKNPIFIYDNIKYNKTYSDYILWNEIIEFSKADHVSNIFLITDDAKDDWWYKVDQNGPKTISPRPELISEIKRKSNVNVFHMYNSESFLKYASDALDIEVSSEAINEVKDINIEYQSELFKSVINLDQNNEKKLIKYLKHLDLNEGLLKQKEEEGNSRQVTDLDYDDLSEFSKSVIDALDNCLHNGIPQNAEIIASDLDMSYPTLRRKLRSEYLSFQILKDFTRYKLILILVTEGERNYEKLALKTGFTEESTFHRAFKTWTGMTISNFIKYKIEFRD